MLLIHPSSHLLNVSADYKRRELAKYNSGREADHQPRTGEQAGAVKGWKAMQWKGGLCERSEAMLTVSL